MNNMNSSAAVDAVDTVEVVLGDHCAGEFEQRRSTERDVRIAGLSSDRDMGAHGVRAGGRGDAERMLLDAAHGLRLIALGDALRLDEAGRERAGRLADMVRQLQEALEADFTGLWW